MEFDPKSGDDNVSEKQSIADQLIGEGKTFKDVDSLAQGKLEADKFIEQLKAENAEMRKAVGEMESKVTEASTMDSILEAVRTMSKPASSNEPPTSGDEQTASNQPRVTEDDIRDLVARTLKQNEAATQAQSNYESVRSAFNEKFKDPDKARLEYRAAADSLGMSEEELDKVAKTNPKLVLRAAGLERALTPSSGDPSYIGNPRNSDRTGAGEAVRDAAWWSKQRRERGNTWYFQPSTQQAYWKDVNALGDSFFQDNK